MVDISRLLGDVFKAEREKTGLSQQQVGLAAGVDNRTVLNIENYRGNPLYSNLFALVRYYKLDPRILFYPEMQQKTPSVFRLQALIGECSEEEAAALYPVVESAIRMSRNNHTHDVK